MNNHLLTLERKVEYPIHGYISDSICSNSHNPIFTCKKTAFLIMSNIDDNVLQICRWSTTPGLKEEIDQLLSFHYKPYCCGTCWSSL